MHRALCPALRASCEFTQTGFSLDTIDKSVRPCTDAYAHAWGSWMKNNSYAQADPHSPGKWCVNGSVSNMSEFQKAFGCSAGQPMARSEKECRVW